MWVAAEGHYGLPINTETAFALLRRAGWSVNKGRRVEGELKVVNVSDVRNLHKATSRFYCAFRNVATFKLAEATSLHAQANSVIDLLTIRWEGPSPSNFMSEACAALAASHGRPSDEGGWRIPASWHDLAFGNASDVLNAFFFHEIDALSSSTDTEPPPDRHTIDFKDSIIREIANAHAPKFERTRLLNVLHMLTLEEAEAVRICRSEGMAGTVLRKEEVTELDFLSTRDIAMLVGVTPKTINNRLSKSRKSSNKPKVKFPGAGQLENSFSYAGIRPWLLDNWPSRAVRFPESFADVKKILDASL